MLTQIALGTGLLIANLVVMAVAALVLEVVFRSAHPWLIAQPQRPKLLLMLIGVGLWVLGVVTAGVWSWAGTLHLLGAFATMEEAVYFALECFTTLGLGDMVPPTEWRILAAMTAVNGFLSFGLLTALLVEALRQVRLAQLERRHD
ncbi:MULTISPECIES: potassium channel family protein [Tabrizicola]|uniref:potassium channel family protein n=1 Tax=Tabrizicola TaxID=1443919 RepID=UPI00108199F0|nr:MULTISPECIES: potassium channel family protein [Paracoccaceae]